ncbi:MAG: hypothetical protein AAGM22_32555 [Acidobacteriota bacterium]
MTKTRAPSMRRASVFGIALLAGAVTFFWLSVVSAGPTAEGLAAQPWPDGAEYLDAAVSIHRHGRAAIHIGGEEHPSRYPAGFSLVTAAFLAAGVEPSAAPYRVNQFAGALLLFVMAGWLAKARGVLEAGVASLLLATFPSFVLLCRSPLSEISASVLVLGAVGLLYAFSRGGSLALGASGAALLGLATSFRLSNLFLATLILAAVLSRRAGWRQRFREASALGAAMGLGVLPFFLGNWMSLGHPLENGYGYWVPYWSGSRAFSLEFLQPNLLYDLRELVQREDRFTTANLYGSGSYFGPALVALIGWALWTLRKDRRVVYFAIGCAMYYGAMKLYFFQDARLIFPVFLLALPAVASAIGRAYRRAGHARSSAGLGGLLLLATILGFPGPGGHSETAALLRFERPSSPGLRFAKQLSRIGSEGPPLVLTDMNPPYVHAVTPPDTQVAPLYDNHLYRNNPEVFEFGATERRALVAAALLEERSVWVLTYRRDIRTVHEVSPAPAGYAWEIVATAKGPGLARLVAHRLTPSPMSP